MNISKIELYIESDRMAGLKNEVYISMGSEEGFKGF